ncbi:ParA family protein [Bradyrhizobium sp. SZCCHNR1015]|uniref:ParA family protein n=1 Tax=Bradyrhizobium sp. SZCCHNR1015 TaxID=3057338 RepID=UPI002916F392|nr:ParA family protein [Bradyrhizobium sp. SZCCHNR1015]
MTNRIITLATLKGGSGKSTVATCLAVHWHLAGRRVVLVDADPQRSVVRLAERERALAGLRVVEDATEGVWRTAKELAKSALVIIDTPGFRTPSTLGALAAADLVIVPVKPSPLDVDAMLDTLAILVNGIRGWRPLFRCLLTQTTRESVIAKHIRVEIMKAGFPLLDSEMQNRVAYPEAALYGATPELIDEGGRAAQDIAAIADEIDRLFLQEAAA